MELFGDARVELRYHLKWWNTWGGLHCFGLFISWGKQECPKISFLENIQKIIGFVASVYGTGRL